jgi:aspartate aminotransferase/aminotransferase
MPYTTTVADLPDYMTERTRIVIVNNPNNPRGSVLSEDELALLLDTARAHDAYVLSDEAYSDFVVPGPFRSAGALDRELEHTIVCNSLSKGFGISGWRIGYAISNAEVIDSILKINQHVITCPATILEHYVARHFDELAAVTAPQIRDVLEKRAAVAEYLQASGLDALPGSATFYLFVSIAPTRLTSEEFSTRLLHEENVAVVPGSGYGPSCDAFVRVSVGAEPLERIRTAIDAMARLIRQTS